jgi:hypothetical protein
MEGPRKIFNIEDVIKMSDLENVEEKNSIPLEIKNQSSYLENVNLVSSKQNKSDVDMNTSTDTDADTDMDMELDKVCSSS